MKITNWILAYAFLLVMAGVLYAADSRPIELDAASPSFGIQEAIDALGEQGGEVVLPAGRIVLRRSIMMRDNVTLRGQGPDKTVLTTASRDTWLPIQSIGADSNTLVLESVPSSLTAGVSVFAWGRKNQTGWLGYYIPSVVTEVNGNRVTLDRPVRKGSAWISFGLCSVLLEECKKGDARLRVAKPDMFAVGEAVVVGSGDGNNNESLSFVKAVEGDHLVLERPIRQPHPIDKHYFWKRPAAWKLFPLITGESAKNVRIADMTLVSPIPADERPKLRRYTCSLLHVYNLQDSVIENLHVRNSFTDGISVQNGENVVVRSCVVSESAGNGFHPGTSLKNSQFLSNISTHNGTGLYFCWHNNGLLLRDNQFVKNGAGITGLGNPSDRNNIIEQNLIAENRGVGIQINGGGTSNNVIRRNTIRDNSMGVLIHAASEDARAYTIEANVFEDTDAGAEQKVGIEERNGKRKEKVNYADENIIRNNTFKNMASADIIRAGQNTVIENPGAVVVNAPVEKSSSVK